MSDVGIEYLPLAEAWRWLRGGDPKFEGLSLAGVMGVATPAAVVVRVTGAVRLAPLRDALADAVAWLCRAEGRALGERDARGVPLMIGVRFGDKHVDPAKPPSVCFLGAVEPPFVEEHRLQLARFHAQLGLAPTAPLGDPIAELAEVARLGLDRLAGLGRSPPSYFLLQRTACGLGLPASGHGTAYTRHPQTWEEIDYGRYAWDLSGRRSDHEVAGGALIDGRPAKQDLAALAHEAPEVHRQLRAAMAAIENYHQDVRFVEFVIERGQLLIVQITPRKRAPRPYVAPTRTLDASAVALAIPPAPGWHEAVEAVGLRLEVASDNPALAHRAVAALHQLAPGEPVASWRVAWSDREAPRVPSNAGLPVTLVRSSHGRHLVGRWFPAQGAIQIDRERTLIVREAAGLHVIGPSAARGGGGYLLKLTAQSLWRAFMEAHGHVLYHAAAVELTGRVILLVGDKGAGKTTLMLALIERGARFVSADRVFVHRDGRVTAWPGHLRVARSTLIEFAPRLRAAADARATAWSAATDKYSFELDVAHALFPGAATTGALGACVLLRREVGGAAWRLDPVPEAELATAMAHAALTDASDLRKGWIRALVPAWSAQPTTPRFLGFRIAGAGHPELAAELVASART